MRSNSPCGHPDGEKANFISIEDVESFFAPLRLCVRLIFHAKTQRRKGQNSYAPMSITPFAGLGLAVPGASSVCSGGWKAGGKSGLMNGWPAGLAGAGLPALMSGLPEAGRTSYV